MYPHDNPNNKKNKKATYTRNCHLSLQIKYEENIKEYLKTIFWKNEKTYNLTAKSS